MQFFLIVIGIVLIVLNLKAIKKEKVSFKEMVKHEETEITDFDVAIGELRREFSETILELQKEIYDLKEKLNAKDISSSERELTIKEEIAADIKINDSGSVNIGSIVDLVSAEEVSAAEDEANSDSSSTEENSVRIKEIGELLKQGISLDDICEKYNIGKGEVLLIRELYLR